MVSSNEILDKIVILLISELSKLISGNTRKLEGHVSGRGENSQVIGSNELVLTKGNIQMKFTFNDPRCRESKG